MWLNIADRMPGWVVLGIVRVDCGESAYLSATTGSRREFDGKAGDVTHYVR
jgi:hypothetical protein